MSKLWKGRFVVGNSGESTSAQAVTFVHVYQRTCVYYRPPEKRATM